MDSEDSDIEIVPPPRRSGFTNLPPRAGQPRLITAVKNNNFPLLEKLLGQSNNYNRAGLLSQRGPRDTTALHWAAKLGQVEVLELLVAHIEIDAKDASGRTALFYAVDSKANQLKVLEILLYSGARVNQYDKNGKTALWVAADKGKLHAVEKLVELDKSTLHKAVQRCDKDTSAHDNKLKVVATLMACGADVHAVNKHGATLLHLAAYNGCLAVLNLLKGYKDLATKLDKFGYTPFGIAAERGWKHVLECLLEHFDVDIEAVSGSWTPLIHAADAGHLEAVKYLVSKGANLMAKSRTGYLPVFIACINRHDEVAMALLASMTRSQALLVTNEDRVPLISIAAGSGCTRVVARLLEYLQADNSVQRVLSEMIDRCTVAYEAIRGNHHATAMLLLANGASTQGVDGDGNTVLHWAAIHGDHILIQSLLEGNSGSNQQVANMNRKQETPVTLAAAGQHDEVVALLLKHQDPHRIHGQNTNGWKALHWAAWYMRLDLVRLLITKGADITKKDASDRTASQVAQDLVPKSIEMLEWLTLPETLSADQVDTELQRPVLQESAEDVCKDTQAYIMDIYGQRMIEKTGFSVHNIIYEYGPHEIMSAAAKARRIDNNPDIRWIHLPANNDLVQTVCVDHAGLRSQARQNERERYPAPAVVQNRIDSQSFESFDDLSDLDDETDGGFNDVSDDEDAPREETYRDKRDSNQQDVFEVTIGLGNTDVTSQMDGSTTEIDLKAQDLSLAPNPEKIEVKKVTFSPGPPGDMKSPRDGLEIDLKVEGGSENGKSEASEEHYPRNILLRRPRLTNPTADLHVKLQVFIEECLPHENVAYPLRRLQSFFKMPYLTFTKAKHHIQSQRMLENGIGANQIAPSTDGNSDGAAWERKIVQSYGEQDVLQLPQTLGRFYYHALSNIDDEMKDHVLFQHQDRKSKTTPESDRAICMVDQLWVFLVDNATVITSCSKQQDPDIVDIQKSICEHLTQHKDRRPHLGSAFGMIPLAIAVCARRTIDWQLGVDKERLLGVFASAIALASRREVELFDEFTQALATEDRLLRQYEKPPRRDIRQEIELLREVKRILDELNIIKTVLLSQKSVLDEAFSYIAKPPGRQGGWTSMSTADREIVGVVDYYRTLSKVDLVHQEVDKLIHDAKEVQNNINHLLDLRQKDANLSEAIWTRKSSEDTTRQSRTVMVFTVVTIVFLPITFLSSLFALDIKSFPHDEGGNLSYSPEWAYSRLVGITFAVSVPLVLLAFFVNEVSDWISGLFSRGSKSTGSAHGEVAGPRTAQFSNQKTEEIAAAEGEEIASDQASRWRNVLRRRPVIQRPTSSV
ncbi:hypothetical protein PFICI_12144 [Pestalotiopsis fici W106-1]|uniref:Uncharacterized protein n=1 Tax=Pestalotiopsis fici (strain W106-1 / CGMCC3.15140) TaxID=1229662 RepID=W3WUH1_PESFW|nr:uncharacterized protein PFICI_12144 [Pestalotiopsis fici W106-1]ETS76757.1 hypothetical protein PFICI_12144 [Pestalotiopsis fici W106-1]